MFASSEDSGRCFYISIIQELAKRFDLPESIKGPYLLEKAREQALYSDPVKWVLMCLFVLLKVYPDWYNKTTFDNVRINRDIFHDPMVIEIMKANFIVVQVSS